MRLACAVLLAAFAVGCGSDESNEASTEISQVLVEQVAAGTGTYIEGAFSYVQVLDPDGSVRVEQRAQFRLQVSFRFPLLPGEYRLVSYQRPCGGNCGNLDPPTDRCDTEISVSDAQERVAIRVTPGEGCTIDLDPPA